MRDRKVLAKGTSGKHRSNHRSSPQTVSLRSFLRENRWSLAFLVGLALTGRGLYLLSVRDAPLFNYLISDSRAYVEWAREIAGGDWLGIHRGVFYQPPLYSYLLAVVFALGGDLETIRWIQVLLSSFACALIASAGALLWGRRSGLLSGLILALYGPAIFFDTLVQKESVGLFLFAALLLTWTLGLREPRRPRWWFLAGIFLGALCLLRENALVLVPLLMAHVGFRSPRPTRMLLVFSLGWLTWIAPITLRNGWVGNQWALTTSQSGPNFYIGNHEGARGVYEPLRPGRSDTPFEREDAILLAEEKTGRELTSREVSKFWWREGLSFWREHPLDALNLLGRKLILVIHPFEIADAEDLYLAREDSWILKALSPMGMGLLVPLAALALIYRWPDSAVLQLVGMSAMLAGSIALFFVMARYRFYLVPPMVLLAGLGASSLLELRGLSTKRKTMGVGAVVLFAVILWMPIERVVPLDRSMSWVNRGVALAGLGQLEAALFDYRQALAINPNSIEANGNLGSALRVLGRPAEALPYLEIASTLAPEDAVIRADLGATRYDLGQWRRAVRDLEVARTLDDGPQPQLDSLLEVARQRVNSGY